MLSCCEYVHTLQHLTSEKSILTWEIKFRKEREKIYNKRLYMASVRCVQTHFNISVSRYKNILHVYYMCNICDPLHVFVQGMAFRIQGLVLSVTDASSFLYPVFEVYSGIACCTVDPSVAFFLDYLQRIIAWQKHRWNTCLLSPFDKKP